MNKRDMNHLLKAWAIWHRYNNGYKSRLCSPRGGRSPDSPGGHMTGVEMPAQIGSLLAAMARLQDQRGTRAKAMLGVRLWYLDDDRRPPVRKLMIAGRGYLADEYTSAKVE